MRPRITAFLSLCRTFTPNDFAYDNNSAFVLIVSRDSNSLTSPDERSSGENESSCETRSVPHAPDSSSARRLEEVEDMFPQSSNDRRKRRPTVTDLDIESINGPLAHNHGGQPRSRTKSRFSAEGLYDRYCRSFFFFFLFIFYCTYTAGVVDRFFFIALIRLALLVFFCTYTPGIVDGFFIALL